MSKDEFLEKLRKALGNDLAGSIVQENVDYYRQYISDEVTKGRSEADVIAELGDPWAIARNIIDVAEARGERSGSGEYGRDGQNSGRSYGSGYGSGNEYGSEYNQGDLNSKGDVGSSAKLKLALVIAGIIAVLILLFAVVAGIVRILAPVIIPVLLIILLVQLITRK